MSDLYERRQVTARIKHKCHLCGEIIPPGVWYIREKWRDDGFMEVKRHIHCDALLDEFFRRSAYSTGYAYTDDEVWAWIRERCLEVCSETERLDCCNNPFSCWRMVASIPNENSRNAAEHSLRDIKI